MGCGLNMKLFWQFINAKGAATEVNGVIICRCLFLERTGDRVKALASMPLGLKQACLPENLKVLGNIVLRHPQAERDLIDVERLFEEQTKYAKPGGFTQGFESWYAIGPFHELSLLKASTVRKPGGAPIQFNPE